jgi:hypothetical protein
MRELYAGKTETYPEHISPLHFSFTIAADATEALCTVHAVHATLNTP